MIAGNGINITIYHRRESADCRSPLFSLSPCLAGDSPCIGRGARGGEREGWRGKGREGGVRGEGEGRDGGKEGRGKEGMDGRS